MPENENGVVFPKAAADRIAAATRRLEAQPQQPQQAPLRTANSGINSAEEEVRCTSSTADANGFYPGTITEWQAPTPSTAAGYVDFATVLLSPSNGETLVSGTRYPAKPAGIVNGTIGGVAYTNQVVMRTLPGGSGSGSGSTVFFVKIVGTSPDANGLYAATSQSYTIGALSWFVGANVFAVPPNGETLVTGVRYIAELTGNLPNGAIGGVTYHGEPLWITQAAAFSGASYYGQLNIAAGGTAGTAVPLQAIGGGNPVFYFDTDSYWPGSASTKLIAPSDGRYTASATCMVILGAVAVNDTQFQLYFKVTNAATVVPAYVNAGDFLGYGPVGTSYSYRFCLHSMPMKLQAGDYVEIFAYVLDVAGGMNAPASIIDVNFQLTRVSD